MNTKGSLALYQSKIGNHQNLNLTPQKITSYAPDTGTAQRAIGIAHAQIWHSLEGNGRAIWGTYGYVGAPFMVSVDFEGPAFSCTCPVKRKPCKHGIALLLVFAKNNDAFQVVTDPPEWVATWLQKRDERGRKQRNITVEVERSPEQEKANAEKRQANRDSRLEKMAGGLDELENWLTDLFRQGLATLENYSHEYWSGLQSRMADASLTGISKRLRQLPLLMSQEDWHEPLLAELGDIYLIVKGFRNIKQLPEPLQDDLLSLSGVNFKKADVLEGANQMDYWLVAGQTETQEEGNLTARRTWLVGEASKQNVLVLDFAWGGTFDTSFKLGTVLQGEVAFYPSAYPQRVLLKNFVPTDRPFDLHNGYSTLFAFADGYAKAIGQFPWLSHFPAFLKGVVPVFQNDNFVLVDSERKQLPTAADEELGWKMVAMSGGHPTSVFGVWDGQAFQPLSTVVNGQFRPLVLNEK